MLVITPEQVFCIYLTFNITSIEQFIFLSHLNGKCTLSTFFIVWGSTSIQDNLEG